MQRDILNIISKLNHRYRLEKCRDEFVQTYYVCHDDFYYYLESWTFNFGMFREKTIQQKIIQKTTIKKNRRFRWKLSFYPSDL